MEKHHVEKWCSSIKRGFINNREKKIPSCSKSFLEPQINTACSIYKPSSSVRLTAPLTLEENSWEVHCWRVLQLHKRTLVWIKCHFAKVKQILCPAKCRIVQKSLKEHLWEENTSLPIPWKCSRPDWMRLWAMWSSGNHYVILRKIERWWKISISIVL